MARTDSLTGLSEHWFVNDRYELRAFEIDPQVDGDVPTFVLIHGIGVSSKYFAPLGVQLSAHGRVFVLDLPGFGGVPRPERKLYIQGFAAVVRSGLDALGVKDPVVIGHSMGAQVAVELAVAWPHLGGRLVLVGPVVPADRRNARTVLGDFIKSSVHERFAAALRSVQGYIRARPSWMATVFPAMLDYPIEQRIQYVKGRIAIVHGSRDVLCSSDWVDELAAAATEAQVTITLVDGASHQLVVDHAHHVVAAALDVAKAPPP